MGFRRIRETRCYPGSRAQRAMMEGGPEPGPLSRRDDKRRENAPKRGMERGGGELRIANFLRTLIVQ
ncbi:hypothetical protein KPH14_005814 [Odynerus spinipes]|uniref:Uncharacterized protein n=1 Tax=Odynerus spinipes TaxID=1348599 RepID=A0AAD9RCG5_9HYME|nr:hypothetical protein KPH14_005814 [Odynerus spinipes]